MATDYDYILRKGNLGIGTASPYSKLTVHDGNIAVTSDYNNAYIAFGNTNGTTGFTTGLGVSDITHQYVIYDNTVGTPRFIINPSGSISINTTSLLNENTLTLGPSPAGGTGEGGQLGLNAAGGSYTSASFLDTWQDQFRLLRGPNGGSNAGLVYVNLHTGNTQFIGAVTASAYSGLPNSYLHVSRTTSQTIASGTWANRDILFDNEVAGNGISYNNSTGLASLTGGKVYRITARLAWNAAAVYLLQYSCYDSSNNQIGPFVEIVQSPNGSFNISDGTLDFIYEPTSNIDIKIRTTANCNALSGETIRGNLNTQLIIQQIA